MGDSLKKVALPLFDLDTAKAFSYRSNIRLIVTNEPEADSAQSLHLGKTEDAPLRAAEPAAPAANADIGDLCRRVYEAIKSTDRERRPYSLRNAPDVDSVSLSDLLSDIIPFVVCEVTSEVAAAASPLVNGRPSCCTTINRDMTVWGEADAWNVLGPPTNPCGSFAMRRVDYCPFCGTKLPAVKP
jgi:hypothetical protein